VDIPAGLIPFDSSTIVMRLSGFPNETLKRLSQPLATT
jgi:hypothetical protein